MLFGEDAIWPRLGQSTMLVLTGGAAVLLYGTRMRHHASSQWLPGLGWLRRFGRLSYEVYLSHMAVVFAGVALFRASGCDEHWGFMLYPPVLAAALGLASLFGRAVTQHGGAIRFSVARQLFGSLRSR